MNNISPYEFDPASPLYRWLASTCNALRKAAHDGRYTSIAKRIASKSLLPEQWEAATASWRAALLDANGSCAPWYTAVARIVHRAPRALGLPEGSPFQPICVRGPGNREVVVSMKVLEELFGWEAGRCPGILTFGDGLNFGDLSPELFEAIMAYVAKGASLPEQLLPQLFIVADQWSAPVLQAAVIEQCKQLPPQRMSEPLRSILVANDSIVNSMDLDSLIRLYGNTVCVTRDSFRDVIATALTCNLFSCSKRLWYKVNDLIARDPTCLEGLPRDTLLFVAKNLSPPAERAAVEALPAFDALVTELAASEANAALDQLLIALRGSLPAVYERLRKDLTLARVPSLITWISSFFKEQIAKIWNPKSKTALQRHREQVDAIKDALMQHLSGIGMLDVPRLAAASEGRMVGCYANTVRLATYRAWHRLPKNCFVNAVEYVRIACSHRMHDNDIDRVLSQVSQWPVEVEKSLWAKNAVACVLAKRGDVDRALMIATPVMSVASNDTLWLVLAFYVAEYDTTRAIEIATRYVSTDALPYVCRVVTKRAALRGDGDAYVEAFANSPYLSVLAHMEYISRPSRQEDPMQHFEELNRALKPQFSWEWLAFGSVDAMPDLPLLAEAYNFLRYDLEG